ncbi:unnamed protein product, partial [Effrenium voratum]
ADVSSQLALAVGPPYSVRPREGEAGTNFRGWVEALAASHVVCSEHIEEMRQAFPELQLVAPARASGSGRRRSMLAACFRQGDVRASAVLSCAQRRFFYLGDARRGLLGFPLGQEEEAAICSGRRLFWQVPSKQDWSMHACGEVGCMTSCLVWQFETPARQLN